MNDTVLASSYCSLFRYFSLAGVLKNRLAIFIMVPFLASDGSFISNLPPFIWICVPISLAQVIRSTSDTDAIEGNASPRKPKVFIKNKSSSLLPFFCNHNNF